MNIHVSPLKGCIFSIPICNTNKTHHYWKPILCRGLLGLPRARSRALGKGSICRGPAPGALGKEAFAEGLALGKETTLGKINLCRGPSPRQIWPDGSRRPLALIFAECPPSGTRQRFFFNILCRGPLAKPSAKIPFAECRVPRA